MSPKAGGCVGLVIGAITGWLVFGSVPASLGLGGAVGASIYGVLSALYRGTKR